MNTELVDYIKKKRESGIADDQIHANLIASGWQSDMVDAGLKADLNDDVPPPPPPAPTSVTGSTGPNHPVAVVNTFTTKGLEYTIMFIALWVGATSLGFLLHGTVDALAGRENWFEAAMPFASAALLVNLPVFAALFLSLKKAELKTPAIRNDPSRKRSIQLTLIVTFLIGMYKIITYLYSLLNGGYGLDTYSQVAASPFTDLIHTIITVGIAGGIFAYYWHDIHKKDTYKL